MVQVIYCSQAKFSHSEYLDMHKDYIWMNLEDADLILTIEFEFVDVMISYPEVWKSY